MTTAAPTSQVFDFEAIIKSDAYALLYDFTKIYRTIVRTTGSLSTIASICIIIHILRSHYGLSTAYHRLVFGLCVGDILFSFFAFVLGNVMVPEEYEYLVSGAMGNQITCDVQGFLRTVGSGVGFTYNMCICLYYLAIVTFNKKDDFIRKKLEPWFHGISISFNLALCSAILAINGFNSDGDSCWFVTNSGLLHCMGLERGEVRDGFTIPCGRGDGNGFPTLYSVLRILYYSTVFLTPIVIAVTMGLMYRTVHKVEKKMRKYGTGALRLKNNRNPGSNPVGNNSNGGKTSTKSNRPNVSPPDSSENRSQLSPIQLLRTCLSKIPCIDSCFRNDHPKSRSNTLASQKRTILHRALGYVVAWCLSWIPVVLIVSGVGTNGRAIYYNLAIFHPSQGVFNFIAFMLPKVRNAKKGPKRRTRITQSDGRNGSNHANAISWPKAFVKAYMSRGQKRTSGQYHSRTNYSSNGVSWKNKLSNTLKRLTSTSVTALLSRGSEPMNNSNSAVVTSNVQQQEIHPLPSAGLTDENTIGDVDGPLLPAQNDYDNGSPISHPATIQRNSYGHSPPLIPLSEDAADDLKEEGGYEGGGEECNLKNGNDANSIDDDMEEEVLKDVYFSEEIQSILE